jgi:integrase/recombinase XerD
MSTEITRTSGPSAGIQQVRADHSGATSDEVLIKLWLAGRSRHTVLAYQRDVELLLVFLAERGRSLRTATVLDLNDWGAGLVGEAATLARRLSAAKSLLTFGHRTGYLAVNVGAALRLPKLPNALAERILTEEKIHALIAGASSGRDRAVVKFLYSSGARGNETCELRWKHLQRRETDCQATLHGKGGKTRHVTFSSAVMDELETLREGSPDEAYVFKHHGEPLKRRELDRIVSRAGKLAGLGTRVSPHWLRHAHASHALDRGAPVHLVQQQLGHASVATTGRYLHARPKDGSSRFLSI